MMADGGDKKVLQTYLESLHYDESHKHSLKRTVTRNSFLADLGYPVSAAISPNRIPARRFTPYRYRSLYER